MPDAPQAGNDDHAEVGVELHRDDAERQPRVLHAALDDDGAPVAFGQPEGGGRQPAEREAGGVVRDDDAQLRQQLHG